MALLPNLFPIVKVYYGKPAPPEGSRGLVCPVLPEMSRVLACLYEKNFQLVNIQNVDCMPVDLIRLQASTSVPTPFFEDGSKFLFESRAICRYISETFTDRGNRYLLGRDLLDRVSIEQWLKSEEQSFDPPSRALVLHLAFPTSNKSYNDLLEESERLAKVLDVYNHRLGESQYLAGDEFTLADLTHLPNSQFIATSEEWGHLFDERENVKRWWEEVSTRPSWSKVKETILEEEEYDEVSEEVEENSIGITRLPPKTCLKEYIFLPEEEAQFGTTKAHFHTPRIDKKITKPSTVSGKIEEPVSDAKVTMQKSKIPPTGTETSSRARIDKASTEPTRVISHSTKPVTDAKFTVEETFLPPADAEVPPIDETTTESAKVAGKDSASPTDRTGMGKSPTSTAISSRARIDKASAEPTRVISSTKPVTDAKFTVEETSFPPSKVELPPTDETTTKQAEVAGKDSASPQPTKLSPEVTPAPPTEKTTTKTPTKDQGQTSATDSNRGQAGEEPTSTVDEMVGKYLDAKHTEWKEQWQRPQKFGEESHVDDLPAQLPKPPKLQDTAPSARQHPVTDKSSPVPAEEPSKSTTTTEPKDTTPPATQEPGLGKTTGTISVPPAIPQEPLSLYTDESQGGITHKTSNVQAQLPKPPKQEGTTPLTTVTSAPDTTSQIARPESTTKSVKTPAEDKTTGSSPAPPAITQAPPSPSTGESTGTVANKTDIVPAQSTTTTSATGTPEPKIDKTTAVPVTEKEKPTVSANQEDSSQGTTVKEPKESAHQPTNAATIPAATQESPKEITGKSIGPSATIQAPAGETTRGIADDSWPSKAPVQSQSGSATQSPKTTYSEIARQEPMTDKSSTKPAEEPSKSTMAMKPKDSTPPAIQAATILAPTQEPAPDKITGASPVPPATKPKDSTSPAPLAATIMAVIQESAPDKITGASPVPPATPKEPASRSTDETTALAAEKAKLTAAATQKDFSLGTTTKEPKETTPPETGTTTIPATTQNSSNETTGKGQASATTQAPPNDKTTGGATDVSSPSKAPAESQSDNTKQTTGDDIIKTELPAKTELNGASTGTKLGNDLAQKSQAVAQQTPPVNEATTKAPATPDTERARSVDGTSRGQTKNEGTSIPPSIEEKSTKSMPPTPATSSDKVTNVAPLQEATKDQASKETTFEPKTLFSNNQKGSKPPQMETKSGTNTEAKTEPDQTAMQPNKSNDATKGNKTLSQPNENKDSTQSKEGASSQNSKPDSTDKPAPANKE